MSILAVGYALPMSDSPTVHRSQIAEARNILGEVIARARFGGEPTILINRGKEAAAVVSYDFYEQAVQDRVMAKALKVVLAGMDEASRAAFGERLAQALVDSS